MVVITGQRDGEFHVAPHPEHYDVAAHCDRLNPIRPVASLPAKPARGVGRALEALALIEIPVIARLNGGAVELQQQLPFELIKRGSTAPPPNRKLARRR